MIIAIDTEDTGLDLFHKARPFFVTICFQDGRQKFWEWPVNPLTREVEAREEDKREIADILSQTDIIVTQNGKFDYSALKMLDPEIVKGWDWEKSRDTLIASHLLASASKHDLTSLCINYLGLDIQSYEDRLKDACTSARSFCKKAHPDWLIAREGLAGFPSVKKSPSKRKKATEPVSAWKSDCWLPLAVAQAHNYPSDHPWRTVCRRYANVDSAVTLALWLGKGSYRGMYNEILAKGLWCIFLERMKLVPICQEMEELGVYLLTDTVKELQEEYGQERDKLSSICKNIASSYNYPLELPKGASPNDSLRGFFFSEEGMNLTPIKIQKRGKKKPKTEKPSLDKEILKLLLETLPKQGKPYLFVKSLTLKRKRDTALSFLKGYLRFSQPLSTTSRVRNYQACSSDEEDYSLSTTYHEGYGILHPNMNITGTDTLRFSMNNPNPQNIEKEPINGRSLRHCFGFGPDGEGWSLDAQNLELRIPSYKAPEPDLIRIFEYPNEPPYFGSYHMVIFDLLHPELFKEYGLEVKKLFASTWYQWVKNGNFALIYGCMEDTADRTYHVQGAFKQIKHRFPALAAFNQRTIALAEKQGYISTIPDVTVEPDRGYPIQLTRSEWGKIEPTKPFNYLVQGTAMWWTSRAMVEVDRQLKKWKRQENFHARILIQCHDELAILMPKSKVHPREDYEYEKKHGSLPSPIPDPGILNPYIPSSNLWRIRILQQIMEKCGLNMGIPTPTGCEYHERSWGEGETMTKK